MKKKSIFILGGYGGVGRSLARLVLKKTNVNLIIAGRRQEKAGEFAAILNKENSDNRVASRYADASDSESLTKAFQGVDMVIVTATTPQYIEYIARSALKTGSDYMDILVRQDVIQALDKLTPEITNAGRIFITQAGFHPGLPAVFIRHAVRYFDDYRKAVISTAMNARFENPESTYEMIHEVGNNHAEFFKDGAWRKATYQDVMKTDFGQPFGIKQCYPLRMEEIKPLPEIFGLKETGVYVAGFNWFVDYFLFPLIMLLRIKKGIGLNIFGKLMRWGINGFVSQEGVVFVLEAEGIKKGKAVKVKITAKHDDPYFFTAVPVVACLKQYLDGRLNKPGLCLMGNGVDDSLLLKDMESMGIQIRSALIE